MAEPFGFMGHTSLKIVERETTEFKTAEVSQPIPNTAAPAHQNTALEKCCELVNKSNVFQIMVEERVLCQRFH